MIPGAGATNFSKNAGLAEPATPFLLKPEDMAEVILHICRMPQTHRNRGVSVLGDRSGSDSDVGVNVNVMRAAHSVFDLSTREASRGV